MGILFGKVLLGVSKSFFLCLLRIELIWDSRDVAGVPNELECISSISGLLPEPGDLLAELFQVVIRQPELLKVRL